MAEENTMNGRPSVSAKAEQNFRPAAEGAPADEYLARGKEVWSDAVRRARSFQGDAQEYVRENPGKAVVTALAVGFVLGLLCRR